MFAKLFDSKQFGQLLIKKDMNDDGCPEVRVYFEPPSLGVCSAAVSFRDDDNGWDSCDQVFLKAGMDFAENVAKGIISEIPITKNSRETDPDEVL